jgi:aryl-alcohol dehydrogenase-like predicted oxidoreductase
MRYGPLGRSGLLVSVVGLGCNNFGSRLDMDGTRAVVDAAIDAGITLFDTSDTYGAGGGSERALGEILGQRRGQVVLATKFGHQKANMGYGPAAGAQPVGGPAQPVGRAAQPVGQAAQPVSRAAQPPATAV